MTMTAANVRRAEAVRRISEASRRLNRAWEEIDAAVQLLAVLDHADIEYEQLKRLRDRIESAGYMIRGLLDNPHVVLDHYPAEKARATQPGGERK